MAPDDLEALFLLYRDMPRQGPGCDDCTRQALRTLPKLSPNPCIFDLGCGPGKQTLTLARYFQSPIIAVDIHEPYLMQLQASAADEGLADLIITQKGSMEDLDVALGSIDLIWLEGAIYLVGFNAGLRLWRPLLRDDGVIVASELTWLTDAPPTEAQTFWQESYPAMTTIAGNLEIAADAGYSVIDYFPLPRTAWWQSYYTPLKKRVEMLRPQAKANLPLTRILDETEREMTIHERYGDSYSYVFYVMTKS